MSPDEKRRRPLADETGEAAAQQTGQVEPIVTDPGRRPCRVCRRRTRPLVPIGSSHGWDVCARCYRSYRAVQRDSSPAAIEAWEERVDELVGVAS
jgi:hypothetical protein